jgi:cytochrome c peroxidase
MLFDQAATLKQIPAYVALFKAAFPELAAAAKAGGDETGFIDDFTESRAQAAFLRTAATHTPFDDFIAGKDDALTPQQVRGAKLFFSQVADGGAGCFSCHSGPMLNKQSTEAAADINGVGKLVEENFVNVGTAWWQAAWRARGCASCSAPFRTPAFTSACSGCL